MALGHNDFSRLDGVARAAAVAASRPAAFVYAAVASAVLLSWVLLVASARRAADIALPDAASPGSGLILGLPELPLPDFLDRFFALCLSPVSAGAGTGAEYAATVLMWLLMAIATMLPTAAPMIRTYCEIADTAAAKGESVVHPAVLVAGYLSVWLAASALFAAATLALREGGVIMSAAAPATGIAGAVALVVAGLYQFSALKQACLEKCRNPFTVLFARWSTRRAAIFRLGVAQGVWCLGCCWALMLVMFAVGLMNIFWMALIGVFSLVEKQVSGTLSTRIAGGILLVWAAGLLVVSV